MSQQFDLSTPASRRRILRMVDVDDPEPHHEVLQALFDIERTWREGSMEDAVDDAFEHVYVAALLLYLIGDPSDAVRLYEAKFRTSDLDLGTGFDAQAIFGAGRDETLNWLREHGYEQELADLSEWLATREDPTIEDWADFKRNYFYTTDGALRLDPL